MIIIITLCIAGLEFYALSKGIDGKVLCTVVGILSTIAGWQLKKKQVEKKK